jgi:L-tartrate/succinate antiporter
MGPVSRREIVLAVLVLGALALWIFGGSLINATLVGLLTVAAMVVARVVTWEEIVGHAAAWNTLAWFGTLVALADGLNRVGFVRWLAESVARGLGGAAPGTVGLGLLLLFYGSHYLFASTTAHATALLPVMLVVAQGVPGLDVARFALELCLTLGLMGILTPYASGPSPIYYGSGYLPARDYWRLGAIFGGVFLAVYLAIGLPWLRWVH